VSSAHTGRPLGLAAAVYCEPHRRRAASRRVRDSLSASSGQHPDYQRSGHRGHGDTQYHPAQSTPSDRRAPLRADRRRAWISSHGEQRAAPAALPAPRIQPVRAVQLGENQLVPLFVHGTHADSNEAGPPRPPTYTQHTQADPQRSTDGYRNIVTGRGRRYPAQTPHPGWAGHRRAGTSPARAGRSDGPDLPDDQCRLPLRPDPRPPPGPPLRSLPNDRLVHRPPWAPSRRHFCATPGRGAGLRRPGGLPGNRRGRVDGRPADQTGLEGGTFTGFLRGCPGFQAGEESDSCGAGQEKPIRPAGRTGVLVASVVGAASREPSTWSLPCVV
jgi:hypothetical protein